MSDPQQNSNNQAIDIAGRRLATQAYVPSTTVEQFRPVEGVDEQSDASTTPNHYATIAIAPHKPITRAKASIFYAVGTAAGAQNLALAPVPGANVRQYVEGFLFSTRLAPAGVPQDFSVELSNSNGPPQRVWGVMSMTAVDRQLIVLPWPIEANALATNFVLITTFTAVTSARVDVAIWGFNRAE